MTTPNAPDSDDLTLGEVLRPLLRYRWRIVQLTMLATVLAAVGGVLYYVLQPTARFGVIGFRATFEQASLGKYPNGLKFSEDDIIRAAIVDPVIEKYAIAAPCTPDLFRAGLSAQQTSPALRALADTYERRISRSAQNALDRQRIDEEYSAERKRFQFEYEVRIEPVTPCAGLTDTVLINSLSTIVEEWAREAIIERGVLRSSAPTAVVEPLLNRAETLATPLPVRIDLVRLATNRLIDAVTAVQVTPDEGLALATELLLSPAEIRTRLMGTLRGRLEPLTVRMNVGLDRHSAREVQLALQTAINDLETAQRRQEVFRAALREYSIAPISGPSPQSGSSATAEAAPLASLLKMSEADVRFRQALAERMIAAGEQVVEHARIAQVYRDFLAANPLGRSLASSEDYDAALGAIVTEVRRSFDDFKALEAAVAREQPSAESSIFRIERPAEITIARGFGARGFIFLTLGVFFTTLMLSIATVLVASHGAGLLPLPRGGQA